MQTTLIGQMDSDMVEHVSKALEWFSGREIKVTIELFTGKKPKADPSNTHQPKKAPAVEAEVNGTGVS